MTCPAGGWSTWSRAATSPPLAPNPTAAVNGPCGSRRPSVLQARIAERIEQVVRDSDVLAARRPGSFVLLVVDPADAVAAATLVSERMLAAFETPFALTDRLQPLALNVGIGAVLPGDDVDVAIARADTALARAVSAGPATYRILLDS